MGIAVHHAGTSPHWRPRLPGFRVFSSSETAVLRWQVLEQIDKELSKGDDRAALSLVKVLQGKPGGLRCFGAARQVLHLHVWKICVYIYMCPYMYVNSSLASKHGQRYI